MSINVALIGSGLFAKESHLPGIQKTPDLTLKAIYSRSLKSAKELGGELPGIDLYSDDSGPGKGYADILARDDIHSVIIALPIGKQDDYIKQALQAGKHALAEKPIAKDVASAKELIKFYNEKIDRSKIFFGIAENLRFLPALHYATEQMKGLGRVLGFRFRLGTFVKDGVRYGGTPWRQKPNYQGGYILDGGVHFVACLRQLLGPDSIARVSAFSAQTQEHLPPVDTVDATWKTKKGVTGTFALAFGSTLSGNEFAVACEKGSVTITGLSKVSIKKGEDVEEKDFMEVERHAGPGVLSELDAWAKGIKTGKLHEDLSAEQALTDLEIVEAMLKSGEKDGEPVGLPF